MKKKMFFGFLLTSIACLVLSSCKNVNQGTAPNEVDTSKDFELEMKPGILSSAKLLSQDEKVAYIKEYNSNINYDDILEKAKKEYKSLVLLYQCNDGWTEINESRQQYSKTVIDLNTGNSWHYEKLYDEADINGEKFTCSGEIETKIVKKNGNYIVRSNLNLNNFACYNDVEFDEYGMYSSNNGCYYASGNANVYTTVTADETTLTFEDEWIKSHIPGKRGSREGHKLYIDESKNYMYSLLEREYENNGETITSYNIDISYDNFYGNYCTVSKERTNAYEVYFSSESVVDDEIDVSDCKQYLADDWDLRGYIAPLYNTVPEVTGLWVTNFYQPGMHPAPLSFFQENFTLTLRK